MKINGVPRPDKHRKLPAKKIPPSNDGGLCGLIVLALFCAALLAGAWLASDGVTL